MNARCCLLVLEFTNSKMAKQNMVWTVAYDEALAVEIYTEKPYPKKKHSLVAAQTWEKIAETLNASKMLRFKVTKKSIQDHFKDVMMPRYKRKQRDEINATGGGDVK